MRVEDVRVDHVAWIDDERARDPRDIPDAVLTVAADRAAKMAQAGRQRPSHEDRQGSARDRDQEQFARPRDGAGGNVHVELQSFYPQTLLPPSSPRSSRRPP